MLSIASLSVACLAPAALAQPIPSDWVAKWRADLAFAADSLPRVHPNFFHAVPPARYRAVLDSLSARVPVMSHDEIVVELARIVALVGDGHTRVTFPFDTSAAFFTGHTTTAKPKIPGLVFRHYPIRLGLFADTLWVIRADSAHRDLLGGRVVTWSDRSAAQAMAAVEPTVQRDNDRQVRDLLPAWLVCPEILRSRGVVADAEHATIVVERDGARVTGMLSPVPIGAKVSWIDARAAGAPPLRDRFPERNHWFTRVPGTTTFYARYREVNDDQTETVSQFADSLFAAIEAARGDRLILDLRGNVGGNGSLNRPLVQHLIRDERLWQPGGLWALIDRGTFSAAVMMSADLEMRTPTLLAGEKTGGHPNSYGDSRRVVLPNSGVTVRVSSLYWQLTSPQDHRDGITPLVPVTMHFADWRANRDPVLEAALARENDGNFAGSWSGEIGWQFARLPLRLDLEKRGSGWSGRVDMPDADLHGAALEAVTTSGGVLATSWNAGGAWRFHGRLAGDRLVGIVRYNGLDYAVALERGATVRTPP